MHYSIIKQNREHSNGRLLFAARKKANMTQKDLEVLTGIDKGWISSFERNQIRIRPVNLTKFCKALNLEKNYFV